MKPAGIRGRAAYVFDEANFDIDLIVGIKNIKTQDLAVLKDVVMKSYDANFVRDVAVGDVLIGGVNFGFGHPHFQPMTIMRHLGIRAVIAESFFPLYRTSEMANGFPQVCCPGVLELVDRWDDVEIDWEAGRILNHAKGKSLAYEKISKKDLGVIAAGGIVPYLMRELADSR